MRYTPATLSGRAGACCTLLLLLACLASGCGGHGANRVGTEPAVAGPSLAVTIPASPSNWAAALPTPQALAAAPRQPANAPILRVTGSQTDPALAPQCGYALDTHLVFRPQWTPNAGTAGDVAWALYRLNLKNYTGESALTFHWLCVGGLEDCYVGLADFEQNHWRMLAGADGSMAIRNSDFAAAREPLTNDLFVLVALTGTARWELASLEAGVPATRITGVTPTTGWTGQALTVTALTSGDFDPDASWYWDLGNGNPGYTATNVSGLLLGEIGVYPCRVAVSDAHGEDQLAFDLTVTSIPKPHIIGVQPHAGPPPPDGGAQLDPDVSGGHQGDGIALEALNTGGPATSWVWDFGGAGLPDASTQPYPDITWAQPGSYQASVTATNDAGSDTYSFALTIEPVRPPQLTQIDSYSGNSLHSCFAGYPATLTAYGPGGPVVTWDWSLDPSINPVTSALAMPVITASATGTFPCSVTATNASGSTTLNFDLDVLPLVAPQITEVNYPAPATSGQHYAFSAWADFSAPVDSWNWDFGGGATPNNATGSSVAPITALAPGNYDCTVTASNPAGMAVRHFTLVVQ